MSFTTWRCGYCGNDNTVYGSMLPPCWRCGAGANGDKPPTADEYYRQMGVNQGEQQ